jgi:hypothetical protein
MRKICLSAGAALCLALCNLCTDVHGGVPTRIPTRDELLDWAATNTPSSTKIVLQESANLGSLNTCGMSSNNMCFKSFADYQSFVASQGLRLFNFLGCIGTAHEIRLKVVTTFNTIHDEGGLFGVSMRFITDVNLGTWSQVTPNSFYVMPTVVQPLVIPVSGLTGATIRHGDNSPVSLSTTSDGNLVFNDTLSSSNGRVRVSLTFTNGETATYTQRGQQLVPPELMLIINPPDPYDQPSLTLNVRATLGADTIIESATSLDGTWTPIGSISWDADTQDFWLYVPTETSTMQLFRAHSY